MQQKRSRGQRQISWFAVASAALLGLGLLLGLLAEFMAAEPRMTVVGLLILLCGLGLAVLSLRDDR